MKLTLHVAAIKTQPGKLFKSTKFTKLAAVITLSTAASCDTVAARAIGLAIVLLSWAVVLTAAVACSTGMLLEVQRGW